MRGGDAASHSPDPRTTHEKTRTATATGEGCGGTVAARTSGQGAGRKERRQVGRDQPRPGGVRLECRGTRDPVASGGD